MPNQQPIHHGNNQPQGTSSAIPFIVAGVVVSMFGAYLALQNYSHNAPKLYIGLALIIVGIGGALFLAARRDHRRHNRDDAQRRKNT